MKSSTSTGSANLAGWMLPDLMFYGSGSSVRKKSPETHGLTSHVCIVRMNGIRYPMETDWLVYKGRISQFVCNMYAYLYTFFYIYRYVHDILVINHCIYIYVYILVFCFRKLDIHYETALVSTRKTPHFAVKGTSPQMVGGRQGIDRLTLPPLLGCPWYLVTGL